jgi:hypothetical protein
MKYPSSVPPENQIDKECIWCGGTGKVATDGKSGKRLLPTCTRIRQASEGDTVTLHHALYEVTSVIQDKKHLTRLVDGYKIIFDSQKYVLIEEKEQQS